MTISKSKGLKAEYFFRDKLEHDQLKYVYKDDWYDFDVEGHKVEIKSCVISTKNGHGYPVVGSYCFNQKDSRIRQHDENIWVGFLLRYKEEFMIIGFLRMQELNIKEHMKISLHGVMKHTLIGYKEWLKLIRQSNST